VTIPSLFYNFNHAGFWRADVKVFGGRLRAPSFDRRVYLWLHRLGLMGKNDKVLLGSLVRSGMRIVDVGANIGLYSFLLSKLTGSNGSIVAFEPDPKLFSTLHYNCKANGIQNIKLFEYALGDTNGTIAFQRSSLNSGDNRIGNALEMADSVQVRLTRMDDVLEDHGVDFVKIDVQGHEFGVFKGMQKILSSNPDLMIYFEFWPDGMRKAKTKPVESLDYLKSFGFRIYQPQENGIKEVADFQMLIDSLPGSKFTNLIASRGSF
jgi:FkbM family methyltransferase